LEKMVKVSASHFYNENRPEYLFTYERIMEWNNHQTQTSNSDKSNKESIQKTISISPSQNKFYFINWTRLLRGIDSSSIFLWSSTIRKLCILHS
jgi:hypothetical protein